MTESGRRRRGDRKSSATAAPDLLEEHPSWPPAEDPAIEQLNEWRRELGRPEIDETPAGSAVTGESKVNGSGAEARIAEPDSSPRSAAPESTTPQSTTPQTPATPPAAGRPSATQAAAPPPTAPKDEVGGGPVGGAPSRPIAIPARRGPAQRSQAQATIDGKARWVGGAEDHAVEAEVDEAEDPLRYGRHSKWTVFTGTGRIARRQPELTPEERELAEAHTEAFPVLDNVKTGPVENAIEVEGLVKTFKNMTAVDGVSFTVEKGKIVALLGPNGAGKTTTVNMICTLLKPDGGTATVCGYDVVKDAPSVRRSIMLTGQFAALDESLTGYENLVLFGRLLGLAKKDAKIRADELLETFSLTEAKDRRVGQYSGGMRRRIDIACGLVTAPEVVFLDEPTTGLDPRSRLEVWALVERMRDSGVTVLLTTQYLEEADSLADNIVVIDRGRVIANGTADELKSATGAVYCEVKPVHPAYLPRLRERLKDLLPPGGTDEEASDSLSVPAPDGTRTLAEVLRRTEAARIPLSDIALRRPSLDEVFLTLTDPDRQLDSAPTAQAEPESVKS